MGDSVSPRDLWALVTQTPRPHRTVPFPRKDAAGAPVCDVRLVLLTQSEMMVAQANAERRAKRMLKDSAPKKDEASRAYEDLYKNSCSAEVLYLCCKHPDDPEMKRAFFRTPEDVLTHLSLDEVGVLMSSYLSFQVEVSPIQGAFDSDDDMDALLAKLVEGGAAGSPLASVSPVGLIQLCMYLARRLSSSQKASSSHSSPVDFSVSIKANETPENSAETS